MTLKKIALTLIIIMILGGGLFAFQQNRQSKALVEHNKQKFQQIINFAQKSSSGGLVEMTAIIKKFHKLNGQYPKNLMQLYPEFIPEKEFITTISWEYETGNGTFVLKKLADNKQIYAMGPEMQLITGKDKTILTTQKTASVRTPEKNQKSFEDTASKIKTDSEKNTAIQSNPVLSYIPKPVKPEIQEKTKETQKIQQEYTVIEKELNNDEIFLLSINTNNLYIWKTHNGIIGFSNIQYPDQKNLTIYKNKTWVEYKYNQNSDKQK